MIRCVDILKLFQNMFCVITPVLFVVSMWNLFAPECLTWLSTSAAVAGVILTIFTYVVAKIDRELG